MRRALEWIPTVAILASLGCASQNAASRGRAAALPPEAATCDMATASPWIETWLDAWELASRRILRVPDAPAPEIVLFDSACVYTTSALTAGGLPPVNGPALLGTALPWRALAHGGSLTLPDSSEAPIQLMSFANSDPEAGPFFVMAAPSYWAEKGRGGGTSLTGVFLHEFAHTRQMGGLLARIGPIDANWPYPEELDDDAVQTHFAADSEYVAAYLAERDQLYRAAEAESLAEVRALATAALEMMRSRRARWFTGEKAVFAEVDEIFLSLEGSGQWTAYAWLSHPEGGGLDRDAAIQKMLGSRRRWTQDQGLALMLAVDRLLPEWPALVFGESSIGAVELLERAVKSAPSQGRRRGTSPSTSSDHDGSSK